VCIRGHLWDSLNPIVFMKLAALILLLQVS
jgi:hypothetical protein